MTEKEKMISGEIYYANKEYNNIQIKHLSQDEIKKYLSEM